jgi:Cu/Ag efflux protein CusF
MKSSYIAIIIVAIIAVAGVGAYFLLSNSGDDNIRTDLKVGDYVEVEMSIHDSEPTVYEDLPVTEFLTGYLYRDTSMFEKTGTETIKFKGQDVVCDVYTYSYEAGNDSSMWVDQTSGVCYKMTVTSPLATGSIELTDTNLDVKKTIDEQVVVNGSFVKAKNTIMRDSEQTATVSDCDGETCTVTNVVKTDSTKTEKFVIKSIDGDKIMTETGIEFTKDTFLAFVSYEYAKKVLEKEHKVAYGEKYSETIDTAFGKKKVTVQEGTYQDQGFDKVTMTFYFDSNNVLYKITQGDTQEMTLKGTSLIKL